MGDANDYITEGLETVENGRGGFTEVAPGKDGITESAADSGESDGRGSAVVGGDSNRDGADDNGQDGDSAVNDGQDNGHSTYETAPGDSAGAGVSQLQTATMGNSETSPASSETEQFEMVSASQFDDAMQQIHDEIAVSNAISIALVAALFAVFGAICVQTLVRSITWN